MSSTKQLLVQARELISKPEHWTKNFEARDCNRRSVPATSSKACSWCMIGALRKVGGGEEHFPHLQLAIKTLHPNLPSTSIGDFNDGTFNRFRSHSEVLAVFDKAIENALS